MLWLNFASWVRWKEMELLGAFYSAKIELHFRSYVQIKGRNEEVCQVLLVNLSFPWLLERDKELFVNLSFPWQRPQVLIRKRQRPQVLPHGKPSKSSWFTREINGQNDDMARTFITLIRWLRHVRDDHGRLPGWLISSSACTGFVIGLHHLQRGAAWLGQKNVHHVNKVASACTRRSWQASRMIHIRLSLYWFCYWIASFATFTKNSQSEWTAR